ncbi:alpha/beta fold hydrolase [Hamadaea sp. NPDC051192]|uniref:thioesterase II family protein n=1 Tax=Hamadaea sp. NPDC051192 TaxID=3154940 RepID=UPI00343D99DC
MVTGGVTTRWLARPVPRPAARLRLYCLPYAGAGANAFRLWPTAFGEDVEIVGVQLPGRETRLGEAPEFAVEDVAAAIAADADRPFALYGHSMGARLAYEVTQALPVPPVRLFVAACRAPQLPPDGPLHGLSELPDAQLVARLAPAGGFAEEVLAEPELLALLVPALRADLAWVDGYRHVTRPPLTVPIVAFAGESDDRVRLSTVAQWGRLAGAGFTLHTVAGGHFFLHERLPELAALITDDLALNEE